MTSRRFLVFAAALALGAPIIAPLASSAAPTESLQQQAARIQDQIDANGARISSLAEEFNASRIRLESARSAVRSAEAGIVAAEARMKKLQAAVGERAAQIYIDAGVPSASDEFDPARPTEFGTRSKYAEIAAKNDAELINQLTDMKAQLALQRAQLERAQQQAEAETNAIESRRREIENANAEQSRILGQVKGEIAAAVAAEESRRRAAEQQAAPTSPGGATTGGNTRGTTPGGGSSGGGSTGGGDTGADVDPGNVPAPSGGASAAIAFARAQLGKPYVYGSAGPDSFDCSGLTMRAWQAGGVSMPHYSGAQYAMFPKVPLNQLQPGDLVFRGPGGSQHVALYIGGGMVIHAPHTGDVVKIAPMGRVIGAARPG